MDLERGNLEILFKRIPYYKISINCTDKKKCHDYRHIDKFLYDLYSSEIYCNNSQNELDNRYELLKQDIDKNNNYGLFNLVFDVSEKFLTYDGRNFMCRMNQLLRWREISFQLGQEFFTCAFLAKYDFEKGYVTKNFSWIPIIQSDDTRLQKIIQKGIAENHFHLAGSTKIFELNWVSLMNIITGRIHDFKKIKQSLQTYSKDSIYIDNNKESFYEECQRAALYRVYLFAKLKNDTYNEERCREIFLKLKRGMPISVAVSEIQDIIYCEKHKYGAKVQDVTERENPFILDYALQKDMIDQNNNFCRILAGERRFLYECYRAILDGSFDDFYKNLFYVYLSIRTHFRGELIQINRRVGFQNFSDYDNRKELFIEGIHAYEHELVRLAVNEQLSKDYMKSLEARLCPKDKASLLYRKIQYQEKIIQEKDTEKKNNEAKDALNKNNARFFYVIHFPKAKDDEFRYLQPRNYSVRKSSEKKARQLYKLLKSGTKYNNVIRGIDACANEIGCRPETFAQIFRFLSEQVFLMKSTFENVDGSTDSTKLRMTYRTDKTRLHMTYHAGEDFLDITDGLRAIDEAILFCGLNRGSRLGHALALGIDARDYYSYKNYRLVLPKQVLLDDLAWILCKIKEYGVQIAASLESKLQDKFCILFDEIFRKSSNDLEHITVFDYYQSWMLRGDNPLLYSDNFDEFKKKLSKTDIDLYNRYRVNEGVDESHTIRKTERLFKLCKLYHFNKSVRDVGNKQTDWKVPEGYDRLVSEIQDKMIKELVRKGICIETNPSSNYLIGTIDKYDKHPIFRFNSRKLKEVDKNSSLCVSINTDDQGVFDTLLENEYALMCLALRKAKDDEGNAIYDIEDIYEWLDYVREMGIEQAFNE